MTEKNNSPSFACYMRGRVGVGADPTFVIRTKKNPPDRDTAGGKDLVDSLVNDIKHETCYPENDNQDIKPDHELLVEGPEFLPLSDHDR